MIEYKNMHWEDDKLFYGEIDTTVRLIKDENHNHMFWLGWNFDGMPTKSVNCYNLTNAKDNARVLYLRYRNNTTENDTETGH